MNPLDAARQIKHRAFVAQKLARRHFLHPAKVAALSAGARLYDRHAGYVFDSRRYPGEWFTAAHQPHSTGGGEVPRVLWLLWTGENPLTPNRARNLEALKRMNPDVDVRLVTPATLDPVLVDGAPLHPAYRNLSLVHRSDYLRAYLMHHHGGAYCDIKRPLHPVGPSLELPEGVWASGYREIDVEMVAQLPGRIGRDLRVRHGRLIGNGAFVYRRGTPLTGEWLAEVHRRLEERAPLLAANPGNTRGDNIGYPFGWTELLGNVMQPLCLKYNEHVRIDERLRLDFTNYK